MASNGDTYAHVNPSMLSYTGLPADKWHVHYEALPHRGFTPVPHQVLKATSDRGRSRGRGFKPGLLTQACLTQLKKRVAAFKKWAGGGGVTVTLWGGDALRLCVTKLSGRAFDVIDTSNLIDNVGLLNLLAIAGPRLRPHPRSGLSTMTISWEWSTSSIQEFVSRSLGGVPPPLFPTLFGLRLLTDFELGSPYPPPLLQPTRRNEARTIEWCPADFAAIGHYAVRKHVLPKVPSGVTAGSKAPQETGLPHAIRRLAASCMVVQLGRSLSAKKRDMPTRYNTCTTLAFVLAAGLNKRWQMESGVHAVAEAMLALLAVPEPFQMEWRALAATIAAAEIAHREATSLTSAGTTTSTPEEASHGQGGAPMGPHGAQGEAPMAIGQPGDHQAGATDVQRQHCKGMVREPPIVLKALAETAVLPQLLWATGKPWKPELRLLVGSRRAAHAVAASSANEALSTAQAHSMQFIDALECSLSHDRSVWSLQFLLPEDHGLNLNDSAAILVDLGNRVDVSVPVMLSDLEACAIPESTLCRLGEALGLRAPATLEREAGSCSPGGVSLAITSCKETLKAYELSVEIHGAATASRLVVAGDIERPTHRCAIHILLSLRS